MNDDPTQKGPSDAAAFIAAAAPEYWLSYSFELKDSAIALYRSNRHEFVLISVLDHGGQKLDQRPLISRAVLLLLGVSIENLLKALLISEDTNRLRGGKIGKEISGHNLVGLAERSTSSKFSTEEMSTLRLLSDVVPYHGKYPVPLSFEKMKSEEYLTPTTFERILKIAERIELEIYRLGENGLDAPEGVRFANLILTPLEHLVYWREPRSEFLNYRPKG